MTTLRARSWVVFLGLLGCGGDKVGPIDTGLKESGPETEGSPWYPDEDGDGYGASYADPEISTEQPAGTVSNSDDCNDDDPDIHPGGTELCNRKDDDCDGEIDEDPEVAGTFYPDGDGDGHGDATGASVRACEPPDGYVSGRDDCDDADAAISPDADEDCDNGVDDDCDGDVDEDESGELAYLDVDGDGWGSDDDPIPACSAPDFGVAFVGGDCDDADPNVYPGAFEYCDGVDNDCDGEVDTDGESQWYRDEDGDGYGAVAFSIDGCDAPAGGVASPGDCDDADPSISPGAVEVCENDVDEDCDSVDSSCDPWGAHGLGESDAALHCGDDDAQTGISVASAGDTSGDGTTDLWVGARKAGADKAGRIALVQGVGLATGRLDDLAIASLTGRSANAYAGDSILNPGDLNGDGYPEVWVGAYYDENEDGQRNGAASLMLGPFVGEESLLDADARWTGEVLGEAASRIASGSDLDGDGLSDLVVGAPFEWSEAPFAGAAYVLLGEPPPGDTSLREANIKLLGADEGGQLGARVSMIGDTDGDGLQELGLNDYHYAAGGVITGAVLVVGALPAEGVWLAADVASVIPGDSADMGLGAGISPMGDVNGDGYEDIAVGASDDSEGAPEAGAVFVLEGPLGGVSSIADATAKWMGTVSRQNTAPVAGGQDMDGDGWLDLAVGGWYGESTYPGAVYIIRGPFEAGTYSLADADATFMGELIGDEAGRALVMLPDASGDGRADLLIGAPGVEDGCGAAYLVVGAAYD